MIPIHRDPHRASYDENGDIILPGNSSPAESRQEELSASLWPSLETEPPLPEEILNASNEEELLAFLTSAKPQHVGNRVANVRSRISKDVLEEGLRQYRESLAGARPMLSDLGEETTSSLSRLWNFLTQPVWFPGKGRTVKKRSRGSLFMLDILRFGGTFAGIFLVLFVSLNYQSFWEIGQARVETFMAPPSVGSAADPLQDSLQQQLKLVPSLATAGGMQGNLVSFLPDVGPPDNRLIIPKLDLNAPIVNPSYQALLKGDWAQVEKDIQTSLQDGVVHYPGTANPGQAGNFFVTGHSSFYPWAPGHFKTIFSRLGELSVGDELWIYYNGDKHRYVIRTKKEVVPSDISVLNQPSDQRLTTLMTCTPVGTTLRRLIIVAEEVDPSTGTVMKVGQQPVKTAPTVVPDALSI